MPICLQISLNMYKEILNIHMDVCITFMTHYQRIQKKRINWYFTGAGTQSSISAISTLV